MTERQYEFSDDQNRSIRDLAGRMVWVGTFGLALGAMLAVLGILTLDQLGVVITPLGLLILPSALWTRRTGGSFQKVVETEGSDIDNVMSAIDDMRKLFTLFYWLALVAIVFALIGLVSGWLLVGR
jgi:UDP-N-acetylmuramyl pentapeptide phosphotransferase/UDP-N-acetylglucosamine-1-phosphate transferase